MNNDLVNLHQRCMCVRSISCCFVLTALLSTTAFGQWLQWGGPNQDFRANAHSLSSSWPETGPKQIWKRDLGDGYSAILVDESRLYTMYRTDDQEAVIAMETKSGKTIWEYKYDSSPAEGHAKSFGEGPRATPLIVGDRIFTIGVSGAMHCLDKNTGKVQWSNELWKDLKGNILNHGYSSSPVAYKNTVIALVGGEGAGLVAFDQNDGHVVWKNQDFTNSYSTPLIINVDGLDTLVTFMSKEIVAIDPANGNLHWQYPFENRWKQNVCIPVWNKEKNILFFSSTSMGARGFKLARKGDKVEYEELWSNKKVQFYHVTSLRIGDYVYGSTRGSAPHFYTAVNIVTGKLAWRERGFSLATSVLADGKVIILDEDGQLGLTTVTPEGFKVLSKVSILEKVTWTVPTIVGKNMYIRDKKVIMALDMS